MEDGGDVEDEGRGVDVVGVGRRGVDPRRRSDAALDGVQPGAVA